MTNKLSLGRYVYTGSPCKYTLRHTWLLFIIIRLLTFITPGSKASKSINYYHKNWHPLSVTRKTFHILYSPYKPVYHYWTKTSDQYKISEIQLGWLNSIPLELWWDIQLEYLFTICWIINKFNTDYNGVTELEPYRNHQ